MVMYINADKQITNTPSAIRAGYNTWTTVPPCGNWYQHTPQYYIDQWGNIQRWDQWNPPQLVHVPGGQYKGTPTRTGSFYLQNTVVNNN